MAQVYVTTNDFSAGAPADDDEVVVVDGNTNDIDAGLDQSGDDYDYLEFAEGYMHNVGASGSYLQCNSDILKILHGGNAWVMSDDNNGAGTEAMDDVLVQTMEQGNLVYLASSAGAQHADSVWHRLQVNRGDVTIEGSVEFDSAAIVTADYVDNPGSDVTLRLIAESGNGNAVPNLYINAGQVFSTRAITTCVIANATLEQDTNAITTLIIKAGGIVKYKHTAGTTIIIKAGGELDFTQDRYLRTFTRIVVCEGGRLKGYVPELFSGTLLDLRQYAS